MTVREEVAELKGTSMSVVVAHILSTVRRPFNARRDLRQMLSGMSDWYHMGFFLLDDHERLLVLVRTD